MRHASYFPCRLQTVCLAVALLTALTPHCVAQLQSPPPLPGQRQPITDAPDDVWQQQQRKDMEKKANLQRQAEIKKDSEKLLELATELKQSVDKSSADTLSLDVIKKAEQIEKLAKSVKEKMKGP